VASTGADAVRLRTVTDGMRAALLRGARVLAYPSLYEGFGLPPLEAMSVDVPVVTTDGGAIPEVVGDAALVVPVGDVDAMAGALRTAWDDEAARQRLIAAGRERAALFTWERTAAGLADLWRRAAAA
jgi:glycosyltransferase involved in cell wall biosynthesis